MDGSMNDIDPIARLNNLVKSHPFLAELAGPMCAFLIQIHDHASALQNSKEANLGHLEQSLTKPMGELLTAVLEQAAQQKADAIPPKCPRCGAKLIRRQKLERTVDLGVGEFKLRRVRGFCRKCKDWFCPADEALGVEGGHSPHVQEMAALFASKMPIAEASAVLERATGMKMPPATLDRVAKKVAEKAQDKRQQLDDQARLGGPSLATQCVTQIPDTLIIMVDAMSIRERDDWGLTRELRQDGKEPKRWHWVWVGTVFGLESRLKKGGRAIISQRGFVATRGGIKALKAQVYAEALRQGLGRVKRVIFMGDGAVWIWNLAKDRFKEAVQRVDLYHIKQHLWVVAKELYPDAAQAALWVKKMKNRLRQGKAGQVIGSVGEALEALSGAAKKKAQKELSYLRKNKKRMDYGVAIKRGEPIGTGAIESTCRQYQCRFKRPGQFWTKVGDEGLLCLETFWRNGRWSTLFPHTKGFDPSKN